MTENTVILVGRLTKDVELKFGGKGNSVAYARFSIAIDRGRDKDGNDLGTDFPNISVFGKQAEFCEKWLRKGNRVMVKGQLRTGKYERDGSPVYTTDVMPDTYGGVVPIDWPPKEGEGNGGGTPRANSAPDTHGFTDVTMDMDVPF